MAMAKQTQKFLKLLYGDLPEGLLFLVWSLQDKQSKWFSDPEKAAAHVVKHGAGKDMYCGVGLVAEDLGEKKRTSRDTVKALVGVVADVDFAGEGKPGYPPSEAEALAVIEATGAEPTVVVHSGNGLQCWWLFNEPHEAGADDLTALSRGWHDTVKEHARRRGWTVDSVWDVARVMRVPGTFNHKQKDDSKLVTIHTLNAKATYEPEQLRDLFVPYHDDTTGKTVAAGATPTRDDWPSVNILGPFPDDKHSALIENSAQYKRTWEHARSDMRGASLSQYDQSLANQLVQAGLGGDEIAAVLRRHRQRNGDGTDKLNRVDYYQRTIFTARRAHDQDGDEQRIAEIVAGDEVSREEQIQAVARRLDVPITNIQVITGVPKTFRFWVGEDCVEMPSSAVVQQNRFMSLIFDVALVMPRSFERGSQPGWRTFANLMARAAEPLDVGDEGTLDGETLDVILSYRNDRGENAYKPGEIVANPGQPFRRGGRLWLRVDEFVRHARSLEVRLSKQDALKRLKTVGAVRSTHSVKRGPRTTTLSFWGVPDNGEEGGE